MLVVDIETAPWPAAVAIGPSEKEISPPNNWKDPNKIAAFKREKREAWEADCATDPMTAQVVALGSMRSVDCVLLRCLVRPEDKGTDEKVRLEELLESRLHEDDLLADRARVRVSTDEAQVLASWWASVAKGRAGCAARPIVGFGHRRFDLPILILRSAIYGLDAQRLIDQMQKYHVDRGIVDWKEILRWWGEFELKGFTLGRAAELLGLKVRPLPIDGAEVPKLWAQGDYVTVLQKLAYDVLCTYELHHAMQTAI